MATQHDAGPSELAEFGYKQELNRTLSTTDLIVYGLVFMVPIAPWAIFGVVFNASSGMVPLVYIIGLVAMIFTALSYAQMSKAFPIAGSVYSYVGRALHPVLGFFAGWTILLDYLLVPTLLYVFAAESMAGIFPGVPKPLWIIVFLIINTGVNYVGISFTAIVNRLFLAAELIFVVIFVIMAIVAISHGTNGAAFTTTPLFNADLFTPQLAAAALSIAVLSFLGFDGIATLSEEAKGGRTRGRRRHDHRPRPRRGLLRDPDLARRDARARHDPVRRRRGQQRLLRHRRLDQRQRLDGRLPGHERPRRRHRERGRRAERHLAAAVLDEPRRPAAPVPRPHRPEEQGTAARDPRGRRAHPRARPGLRRPDRHHLDAWSTSAP